MVDCCESAPKGLRRQSILVVEPRRIDMLDSTCSVTVTVTVTRLESLMRLVTQAIDCRCNSSGQDIGLTTPSHAIYQHAPILILLSKTKHKHTQKKKRPTPAPCSCLQLAGYESLEDTFAWPRNLIQNLLLRNKTCEAFLINSLEWRGLATATLGQRP